MIHKIEVYATRAHRSGGGRVRARRDGGDERRELSPNNIVHAACTVYGLPCFFAGSEPCDGTRRDRALSCRAFYLYTLYLFTPLMRSDV